MSHFTVLVIGENPEKALAPYHEFECTGEDNEYIQDIDITAECREEYERDTARKYQNVETKELKDPWSDMFYRDPTEEELKKHGPMGGTGWGGGISYTSKDWGDGKGYRTKIAYIPEGWVEVKLNTKDIKSFADFVEDYHSTSRLVEGSTPDMEKAHKYGYILVDSKGEVVKVIKRTNPNKKWDWYQTGGRWAGFLKLKEGAIGSRGEQSWMQRIHGEEYPEGKCDSAYKGDIDILGMKAEAREKAAVRYDRVVKILGQEPMPLKYTWSETWDLFPDMPREDRIKMYNDQELIKLYEARKNDPAVKAEFKDNLFFLNIDTYAMTRDKYIEKAERDTLVTHALIKDGKWYEKGEMGWFARIADEKKDDQWTNEFDNLIAGLSDDTLLTVVDCHI